MAKDKKEKLNEEVKKPLQEETVEDVARLLAPILKMSQKDLEKKLRQNYSTIAIAKGVDRERTMQIRKLGLTSISTPERNVRVYPQGDLASHILGYVNPDAKLAAGVEKTGSDLVENAKSKIIFFLII